MLPAPDPPATTVAAPPGPNVPTARSRLGQALAVAALGLGLILLARHERDHPGRGYALASYLLYGLTALVAGLGFRARRASGTDGPAKDRPDPDRL